MIYRSYNVKTLMLIFSNERHMFEKFFYGAPHGNCIHIRFILTLAWSRGLKKCVRESKIGESRLKGLI